MPELEDYAALQIEIRSLANNQYQMDMQLAIPVHGIKPQSVNGVPITFPNQDLLTDLNRGDELAYGLRLFRSLFPTEVARREYYNALSQAESRKLVLHIGLDLGRSQELAALRWELLCDDQNNLPLGASERTAFSRILPSTAYRPILPLPRQPQNVLVAIAAPSDLEQYGFAPIAVETELTALKACFGNITACSLAHTEDQPVTLHHLRKGMRNNPDIVCLMAHGKVVNGEPHIWLENDDRTSKGIAARDLASQLRDLPHPQLVVLIICESAGSDGFTIVGSSLGPQLAQIGIPAVIAVQGRLTMASSSLLLPEFFREVLRTGIVDQALSAARKKVRDTNRSDWARIILWQHMEHGRLWEPVPATHVANDNVSISNESVVSYVDEWVVLGMAALRKRLVTRQPSLIHDFDALNLQIETNRREAALYGDDSTSRKEYRKSLDSLSRMAQTICGQSLRDLAHAKPLSSPSTQSSQTPISSPDEIRLQAETAFSLQEWPTAIDLYARYLDLRPGDTEAQQSLAEAQRLAVLHQRYLELEHLRSTKQVDALLQELHALRRDGYTTDPRGHQLWAETRQHFRKRFDQAVRAYKDRRWADAVTMLKSLLFDYPDDASLRTLANQAHQELECITRHEITSLIKDGHIRAALDVAEARLRQHPEDYEALWEIAQLIERRDISRDQRLQASHLVADRDLRSGVMTLRPEWASAIPAGEYQLSGGTTVSVMEFQVARYPVTIAQYAEFQKAGAYMDLPRINGLWTSRGLSWRNTQQITGPERLPNQFSPTPHMPVNGVSWYEVTAFCNWLTQRGHADGWLEAQQIIRLPTEAEWEIAARWDSVTGRMREWETENLDWLNCDDHHPPFDRPTPVGMFPLGASPSGALDMAGNVWELCASQADNYAQQDNTIAADLPGGLSVVPVRGGSFKEPLRRCGWSNQSSRRLLAANTRADDVGFRVCCVDDGGTA
jgi:formylglycine-generating enzyme required for sulfatase activity/tetratricopeptide (TPR) repeat protein